MENDKLGVISNQHLQLADQRQRGTLDPDCIKLAALASTAVDYSKTGEPANMQGAPKFPRFKPDFMVSESESVGVAPMLTSPRLRTLALRCPQKVYSLSRKKTMGRTKPSIESTQNAAQCATMKARRRSASCTGGSTSASSWQTCKEIFGSPTALALAEI